jgi:diguanylate cyclase (GGDEF)-like protein
LNNLEQYAEEVVGRWKQEMSRLPFPAHYRVLDGEVVGIISRITLALLEGIEDVGVRREFEEYGRFYRFGEDLGRMRKQNCFTMQELVQEHLIFRGEFWGLFRETVALKQVADYQLEKEINRCFDFLLQASAKAYQSEFSREIRENPLRDPLSGLYNAEYFQGRLVEEVRRSVRYGHELSLVLFEMEDYHQLLDREGGERVKEMVRFIAEHLARLCRECDVIARVSDGGFAVLLPETGLRGGKIVAERLSRFLLRELPALSASGSAPALRWGLASYPDEVKVPEKIFDCAREAMIQARYEAPDEVAVYRSPGGAGV